MYDLDVNDDTSARIRKDCEAICNWFLDYKGSIRQCSEELCISKSRVHTYIHTYIIYYYNEEYCQIQKLLNYNKKNRTRPRRFWITK